MVAKRVVQQRKKAAEEQWNEAVSAVKTKLHEGAYPVDFNWQPASWWSLLDLDEANEDSLIMRLYPPWGPSNFVRVIVILFKSACWDCPELGCWESSA